MRLIILYFGIKFYFTKLLISFKLELLDILSPTQTWSKIRMTLYQSLFVILYKLEMSQFFQIFPQNFTSLHDWFPAWWLTADWGVQISCWLASLLPLGAVSGVGWVSCAYIVTKYESEKNILTTIFFVYYSVKSVGTPVSCSESAVM